MTVRSFHVPRRHDTMKFLEPIVQTGDIIVRLSDTTGPFGIKFSALVAKLSDSEWSHASMLFRESGRIYAAEVSDRGVIQYRLIDWLDFCVGGRFAIYRDERVTGPDQWRALYLEACKLLGRDPDYDFGYRDPNKTYCVESVCEMYAAVGLPLAKPKPMRDILSAKPVAFSAFKLGNAFIQGATGKGFDLDVPTYFVGNEKHGLLSTPTLKCVVGHNPYA